MANIFWLSIFAVHIGATRRIRLNDPCVATAAMRPYVKLLWPLLINDICASCHVMPHYVFVNVLTEAGMLCIVMDYCDGGIEW